MDVSDIFISLPIVTKNNKGQDIKSMVKINSTFITSYYEAVHVHDNGDETTITYVGEFGRQDIWGIPISINEFEEKLLPYITLLKKRSTIGELEYKEIPIRYRDDNQSQLLGKTVWIDEFCKFNFWYMTYYHPMKRIYNEQDGEIDVIMFGIGGSCFYTMLSLDEFESIVKSEDTNE